VRVEIRKTAAGTEYWDVNEKRSIFVPAGKDPDFEVTKNPKSMLAKDSTIPVSDEVVLKPIEDMNLKELKDYAAKNEIEIPNDIKKRDDIIKVLADSLKEVLSDEIL
jgi:hypothetical protein